MDKQHDADLEKAGESEVQLFLEEDRAPLFEVDDEIFEEHVSEESEFDYEPDGAFLD